MLSFVFTATVTQPTLRAVDKRRARQNLTVNLLPPSLATNARRWKVTMQTIGYIKPAGVKILVLVRQSHSRKATYRTLKIRKSGKDGTHFSDEEKFFNEEPEKLFDLLNGEVVRC